MEKVCYLIKKKKKLFKFESHMYKKLIDVVGTMSQIYILGFKPYLVIWICPRRSKQSNRLQNGGSHTGKVEEYSPRRLSFLDRGNVGPASTWAT